MDPIYEAYRRPQFGGSYIPVYQGGAGILSDIWRFTKPILTSLAKPALGVAADVLLRKQTPKQALKRRLVGEIRKVINPKKKRKVINVKKRKDIFK